LSNTGKKAALGIDLGGSSIKWGIVNPTGKMLENGRIKLPDRAPEVVIDLLGRLIREKTENSSLDLVGIGVGSPGLVDKTRKIVRLSPNFPLWDHFPIVDKLERFANGKQITFENDANLLVYSETRWGAAVGCKDVIVLTLGTGVGGGVMIDGRLVRGFGGGAGELGHIPLDVNGPKCGCGATGCLEAFCNITGTLRMAEQVFPAGTAPENPAELTRAADMGDEWAIETWRRVGHYLGVGVAALINIFNPEVVLVGGGLTNAGKWLFEPAAEIAAKRSYTPSWNEVTFRRAELEDESGLLEQQRWHLMRPE
jgi:glucokinase